ncbi:MAG: carbon starvation protein A [Victivallaceae bacterium]|nr:carbon starvation CstA family protein [Victivallaceae bacterium]
MLSFVLGLALLVGGYYIYGAWIERLVEPDDRTTPCQAHPDGVDYVALPHWKNMLIQLLNIAGIGPVIGVIIGIKFGSIVFLLIPVGNIIAGATHDFLGGMMSLRHDGANLPRLIRLYLGPVYYWIFAGFMAFLLLLVVAVFINVPASLFNDMVQGFIAKSATWQTGSIMPGKSYFWPAVAAVFLYYIAATLFPVDKIIGRIYPLFGLMLLLGTAAIFGAIVHTFDLNAGMDLLSQSDGFTKNMWTAGNNHPIIPLLFVTIACGIISGFHATQSPIIARTMTSERQARSSFYGMMVVEGIIAMVWAAAALVIYNMSPELMKANPNSVLVTITTRFLGSGWGALTVIAVIVLAVTSGDTAMRSLRLSLGEIFHIDQKKSANRILVCLPLIAIVAVLLWWSNQSAKSFQNLWNYFAWANQVLAASTLMAATVWLIVLKKNGTAALVPGMFMTFIVSCYILWISPDHGGPVGFGFELNTAYWIAGAFTLLTALAVLITGRMKRRAAEEPCCCTPDGHCNY